MVELICIRIIVPKKHSNGDRQLLLGITRKGNRDLKLLLIHGARAVVATALANRTARMAWAVLRTSKPSDANFSYVQTKEGGAC